MQRLTVNIPEHKPAAHLYEPLLEQLNILSIKWSEPTSHRWMHREVAPVIRIPQLERDYLRNGSTTPTRIPLSVPGLSRADELQQAPGD